MHTCSNSSISSCGRSCSKPCGWSCSSPCMDFYMLQLVHQLSHHLAHHFSHHFSHQLFHQFLQSLLQVLAPCCGKANLILFFAYDDARTKHQRDMPFKHVQIWRTMSTSGRNAFPNGIDSFTALQYVK
jgi:hypothetical protein